MRIFAERCLYVWLVLLAGYLLFYCGAALPYFPGPINRFSLLYISLAPLTVGVFGMISMLLFWGTRLRKNWFDVFTLLGSFAAGLLIFLAVLISLAPFSP